MKLGDGRFTGEVAGGLGAVVEVGGGSDSPGKMNSGEARAGRACVRCYH